MAGIGRSTPNGTCAGITFACSGAPSFAEPSTALDPGSQTSPALIGRQRGRCRAPPRSGRRCASRIRRAEPKTRSRARLRAGPTPGSVVEHRADLGLRAQLAVVGDGEAVRLVAQALHEVEGLRVGRQHDRLGASGQEHLLALLGQADERQVVQAELIEHLAGGADLALAAVDDDQVGQPPAQLLGAPLLRPQRAAEAAAQDLPVAREVVGAAARVRTRKRRYSPLRGRPSSKTTMLPTVLRALDGADVVALDAQSAARPGRGRRPAPRGRPASCPRRPASAPARAPASRPRCARRAPSAAGRSPRCGTASSTLAAAARLEERVELVRLGRQRRAPGRAAAPTGASRSTA